MFSEEIFYLLHKRQHFGVFYCFYAKNKARWMSGLC